MIPSLTPPSQMNRLVLPSTGSHSDVTEDNLPFGIYVSSDIPLSERQEYITGSVSQVSYVYRMLGGSVLDVELTTQDVYASYEKACLDYSYLLNLHQAKNSLSDLLGQTTGSFDHKGEYLSGSALSSSLSGGNISLKFPRMKFAYADRYAQGVGAAIGIGGNETIYSASIQTTSSIQDYDLQTIIQNQSNNANNLFYGKVNNKRIKIRKVYYKSPRAIWRFYGYYGGLMAVGNLSTYGQFADDHTFSIVPTWQNKAQAAAYEDAINTRISHYSYKIRNNQLRLFPPPDNAFRTIWIEFSVDSEPWTDQDNIEGGVDGINNMNALPYANIPYKNINSIGKHWIRDYCLEICRLIMANNRGKYTTIPIPGESVTLNHVELASQAKENMKSLREELQKNLDDLTYVKLAEMKANESDNIQKVLQQMPMPIFIG